MLVWSLAELGCNPGEEVLRVIATMSAKMTTPADLNMLRLGFAKLGLADMM